MIGHSYIGLTRFVPSVLPLLSLNERPRRLNLKCSAGKQPEKWERFKFSEALQPVLFRMTRKVPKGDVHKIVGDHPNFGDWNEKLAPTMQQSEGDVWSTTVNLPDGEFVLFQCVHVSKGNVQTEELCDKRHFQVEAPGMTLDFEWGDRASLSVTVARYKRITILVPALGFHIDETPCTRIFLEDVSRDEVIEIIECLQIAWLKPVEAAAADAEKDNDPNRITLSSMEFLVLEDGATYVAIKVPGGHSRDYTWRERLRLIASWHESNMDGVEKAAEIYAACSINRYGTSMTEEKLRNVTLFSLTGYYKQWACETSVLRNITRSSLLKYMQRSEYVMLLPFDARTDDGFAISTLERMPVEDGASYVTIAAYWPLDEQLYRLGRWQQSLRDSLYYAFRGDTAVEILKMEDHENVQPYQGPTSVRRPGTIYPDAPDVDFDAGAVAEWGALVVTVHLTVDAAAAEQLAQTLENIREMAEEGMEELQPFKDKELLGALAGYRVTSNPDNRRRMERICELKGIRIWLHDGKDLCKSWTSTFSPYIPTSELSPQGRLWTQADLHRM